MIETQMSMKFLNLLSSVEEEYYYFLATNILGRLPSPFNRQQVNRSILSFFLNQDNLTAQISAIGDREKQILALIYLLKEVEDAQLLAFCPEMPYYVLSLRLENLCDRLLLFKLKKTYVLNPLLEPFLESYISSSKAKIMYDSAIHANGMDTVVYFSAMLKDSPSGGKTNVPYADSNTARAIFNLLINGAVPQREANLHHFIKSGKLKLIFPRFEEKQGIHLFELYKNLALGTKTVERNGEHVALNFEKCKKLLQQSTYDLNMSALEAKDGPSSAWACNKALTILNYFPTSVEYLCRLINSFKPNTDVKVLFEDLKALGLVYLDKEVAFFNTSVLEKPLERSALTINTDLTVSYYGNPEPTDLLFLFANIQTCDNLVVYAITRDSFARALDLGLSKKTIEDYLNNEELTKSLFDQWEAAVSRIKLYDGIILNCTNELAVIVKGIPEISDHIMKEFSANLFLMRRSTYGSWSKALAKAIDLEALPTPVTEPLASSEQSFVSCTNYSAQFTTLPQETANFSNLLDWQQQEQELLAEAKKKGCLSPELEELITSKLIISKSQIGKDFRYSKLPSASGFDYNAKLSLIKKACGSKPRILRLELNDENLVVFPTSVVKNENGKAILKAKVIPSGEERNISIGSVFKVSLSRSV